MAQWGNKTDHTSPIRYDGTGSVPQEGVFRTLESWDVNRDYEDGVNMRLMEVSKAEQVFAAMPALGGKYDKLTFDAVIFKRPITWDPVKEEIIGDADATRMLSRPFRDKWKIW